MLYELDQQQKIIKTSSFSTTIFDNKSNLLFPLSIIYLFIYLSIYLSVYLCTVCPSVCLSEPSVFCQSIIFSVCLFLCQFSSYLLVCKPFHSVCFSIYLSVSFVSICIVYLCVYLFYISVHFVILFQRLSVYIVYLSVSICIAIYILCQYFLGFHT